MKTVKPIAVIVLLIIAFAFVYAYDSDLYFVGPGDSWNDSSNWSFTSGGSGGAGIPGSSDTAIFDGSSPSCIIGTSVTVSALDIRAAYSNTLTQASGSSLTVGSGGFSMAGGTFAGGDSEIDINGSFSHTGGSFTSTSGILEISADITTGSGFSHNSGTLKITGPYTTADTGSAVFNDLEISMGTYSLTLAGDLDVDGNLTITGVGTINGGNIVAAGDVLTTDPQVRTNTDAAVEFDGTGDQTLGAGGSGQTGGLCGIMISKTGGTLTIQDTIIIETGDWIWMLGDVDASASTVEFRAGYITIDSGDMVFGNVIFNDYTYSHTVNGTMKVGGDLTLETLGYLNDGIIEVNGDLTLNDSEIRGDCLVRMAGDGTQTISGTGMVPALEINKTGGSLTLPSAFSLWGGFTYTAGSMNAADGTIIFKGPSSAFVPGDADYGNIEIDKYYTTSSLEVTGTADIHGDLALTKGRFNTGTLKVRGSEMSVGSEFRGGTGTVELSGVHKTVTSESGGYINDLNINMGTYSLSLVGDLDVNGNLTISGVGTINDANILAAANVLTTDPQVRTNTDAAVEFDGTGDQTLGAGGSGQTGGLCGIMISKTGGTLTIQDTIIIETGDWIWMLGDVDASESTVEFCAGYITIDSGDMVFGNVMFNDQTYSHTIIGTMKVGGDLTLETLGSLSGGVIEANGSLTLNDSEIRGDCLVKMTGDGTQTISGTGMVPALEVNKTGGDLTLTSAFSLWGGFTYTAGSMNAADGTIIFKGPASTFVPGSAEYGNIEIIKHYTTSSLTVTGTADVDGDLGLTKGRLANGTLSAAGDITAGSDFEGDSSSGNVIISGNTDQTISGTGIMPETEMDKTGGALILGSDVSIGKDFIYKNGTLSTAQSSLIALGVFTVKNQALFDSPSCSIQLKDDLEIETGGEINVQSGNFTFSGTSGQSLANSGTAHLCTLAVTNTSTQGVSFGSGFTASTFLCSASGANLLFKENALFTFSYLSLLGTVGSEIKVRSAIDGVQALFSVTNSTVACVDVKDNDASQGQPIDATNNCIDSGNTINWIFEAEEPDPPAGIAAAGGGFRITLDWNDNTEPDLAGYNIYRSISQGAGHTKINAQPVTESEYTDVPLTPGETYYYIVKAVNTEGGESDPSAEVSAVPLDYITVGTDKDFPAIHEAASFGTSSFVPSGVWIVIDAGTYSEPVISLSKLMKFRSASGTNDVVWKDADHALEVTSALCGVLEIKHITFNAISREIFYSEQASYTSQLELKLEGCSADSGTALAENFGMEITLIDTSLANITDVISNCSKVDISGGSITNTSGTVFASVPDLTLSGITIDQGGTFGNSIAGTFSTITVSNFTNGITSASGTLTMTSVSIEDITQTGIEAGGNALDLTGVTIDSCETGISNASAVVAQGLTVSGCTTGLNGTGLFVTGLEMYGNVTAGTDIHCTITNGTLDGLQPDETFGQGLTIDGDLYAANVTFRNIHNPITCTGTVTLQDCTFADNAESEITGSSVVFEGGIVVRDEDISDQTGPVYTPESVGDFYNIRVENCTITNCGTVISGFQDSGDPSAGNVEIDTVTFSGCTTAVENSNNVTVRNSVFDGDISGCENVTIYNSSFSQASTISSCTSVSIGIELDVFLNLTEQEKAEYVTVFSKNDNGEDASLYNCENVCLSNISYTGSGDYADFACLCTNVYGYEEKLEDPELAQYTGLASEYRRLNFSVPGDVNYLSHRAFNNCQNISICNIQGDYGLLFRDSQNINIDGRGFSDREKITGFTAMASYCENVTVTHTDIEITAPYDPDEHFQRILNGCLNVEMSHCDVYAQNPLTTTKGTSDDSSALFYNNRFAVLLDIWINENVTEINECVFEKGLLIRSAYNIDDTILITNTAVLNEQFEMNSGWGMGTDTLSNIYADSVLFWSCEDLNIDHMIAESGDFEHNHHTNINKSTLTLSSFLGNEVVIKNTIIRGVTAFANYEGTASYEYNCLEDGATLNGVPISEITDTNIFGDPQFISSPSTIPMPVPIGGDYIQPGYQISNRIPGSGSPCLGSGENGVDIGYYDVEDYDPVAVIKTDVTQGPSPLIVHFDGSFSYDPDGTITLYEWDFEYNGSDFLPQVWGPAETNPSHPYNQKGVFTAMLRVTSSDTGTAEATVEINVVDNTPPVITVLDNIDFDPVNGVYQGHQFNNNTVLLTKEGDIEIPLEFTDDSQIADKDVSMGNLDAADVLTIQNIAEGVHAILISATDDSGNVGTLTVNLCRDATPPDCRIDAPGARFITKDQTVSYSGYIDTAGDLGKNFLESYDVDTASLTYNVGLRYYDTTQPDVYTVTGTVPLSSSAGLFHIQAVHPVQAGENKAFTVEPFSDDIAGNNPYETADPADLIVGQGQGITVDRIPPLAAASNPILESLEYWIRIPVMHDVKRAEMEIADAETARGYIGELTAVDADTRYAYFDLSGTDAETIDVDSIRVEDGAGNSTDQSVDINIDNTKTLYEARENPLAPKLEEGGDALVNEDIYRAVNIMEHDELKVLGNVWTVGACAGADIMYNPFTGNRVTSVEANTPESYPPAYGFGYSLDVAELNGIDLMYPEGIVCPEYPYQDSADFLYTREELEGKTISVHEGPISRSTGPVHIHGNYKIGAATGYTCAACYYEGAHVHCMSVFQSYDVEEFVRKVYFDNLYSYGYADPEWENIVFENDTVVNAFIGINAQEECKPHFCMWSPSEEWLFQIKATRQNDIIFYAYSGEEYGYSGEVKPAGYPYGEVMIPLGRACDFTKPASEITDPEEKSRLDKFFRRIEVTTAYPETCTDPPQTITVPFKICGPGMAGTAVDSDIYLDLISEACEGGSEGAKVCTYRSRNIYALVRGTGTLQYVPDGEPENEVEYLFGELPSIQVVYYNGWDTLGLEFYGEEMFSADPGKYRGYNEDGVAIITIGKSPESGSVSVGGTTVSSFIKAKKPESDKVVETARILFIDPDASQDVKDYYNGLAATAEGVTAIEQAPGKVTFSHEGVEYVNYLVKMEFVVPDESYYDEESPNYDANPIPTNYVGVSDPRPTVELDEVSESDIVIGSDYATVTLSGIVRDPIADNIPRSAGTVAEGGADIEKVTVYVDGEEYTSTDLNNIDDPDSAIGLWRQFPYKGIFENVDIQVPLEKGVSAVIIETSENGTDYTGFGGIKVIIEKEVVPGSEPGIQELVGNIYFKDNTTSEISDEIVYYYGERAPVLPPDENPDPQLGEQEGEEDSLIFQGSFYGTETKILVKEIFQDNQWLIPVAGEITFNQNSIEKIKADIFYRFEDGSRMIFSDIELVETENGSRIFRCILLSGFSGEEQSIENYIIQTQEMQGSGPGVYNPMLVRANGNASVMNSPDICIQVLEDLYEVKSFTYSPERWYVIAQDQQEKPAVFVVTGDKEENRSLKSPKYRRSLVENFVTGKLKKGDKQLQNVTIGLLQIDLDADTDYTGSINHSEDEEQRENIGIIIVKNNDDDDLRAGGNALSDLDIIGDKEADNSDNIVNGKADTSLFARIVVRKLPADFPGNLRLEVRLSIPAADKDKIQIFRYSNNDKDLDEKSQLVLGKLARKYFTRTQNSKSYIEYIIPTFDIKNRNVCFGIEGIAEGTVPIKVLLKFKSAIIKRTYQYDTINLTVAGDPIIFPSNISSTQDVFAKKKFTDELTNTSNEEVVSRLQEACTQEKCSLRTLDMDFRFVQDPVEFGYIKATSIMLGMQHKNWDEMVANVNSGFKDSKDEIIPYVPKNKSIFGTRAEEPGGIGGNLEVSPPIGQFANGRIIVGSNMPGYLKRFLKTHGGQLGPNGELLEITGTGNVDEMMIFIPNPKPKQGEKQFRIAIADVKIAYIMIRDAYENLPETIQYDNNDFNKEDLYLQDTWILQDPTKVTDVLNRYGWQEGEQDVPQKVKDLAKMIDDGVVARLVEGLGIEQNDIDKYIVRVPVLFGTDDPPGTIFPDAVNMQVVGNCLIIPNQHSRFIISTGEWESNPPHFWGKERFQEYIISEQCLGDRGLTIKFADATVYRLVGGHIHCGTNARRKNIK